MKGIETITPHPIVQMCWMVDDMETAAMQWVQTMGAGPFFLLPHIQLDELTYRGKPAKLDQSSAVGQWGADSSRIISATLQQSLRSPRDVCARTDWSSTYHLVC